MSSKEALYANLADRIVRLNEEMIKFTRQAEATQQVVAKASEVTALYCNMFKHCTPLEQLQQQEQNVPNKV
ncbi:hypothetical protein JH06_2592 [Blastocystis sp. subtype 4]|uniref:hypothetical protein n=1 Tax=Blastocystis sp. subtype 4 TaxID=944170 RepID=UPI000711A8B7|nr:hypothetical protein JH06_2592 [Blastocystis sp. subtype 4]KNB43810.1 hypothetical protein JH06_2592 [Blastocystis sp. subtype 4]|eukprot:XP_014527253.1 hypothetical protein JH06_2592 [Blastocystis sp. subtype 4]